MRGLLALTLIFTAVAAAAGVFVLLARPDVVLYQVLRYTGTPELWFEEEMRQADLDRLRALVGFAGLVGLVGLVGWSFLVGVALVLLRAG